MKPKRARARPTTPDACARYVELVRGGATEREADALAGVNRAAVRNHPEYGPLLEQAAAEWLARQREIIQSVARGEVEDPQQARAMLAAASWLLGKRDRENYGEQSKQELHVTATDDVTAAKLATAIGAARGKGGGEDESE